MQVETLLIRNIAHAGYKCGRNIEVDSQRVLELLDTTFLNFFIVLDTTFLNMDSLRSSRRGLKSAQEQEDRWRHRNERERARRAAETAEQRNKWLSKRRERDCARRPAQTASERQATSQWKSTRERERTAAETPEGEKRGYNRWEIDWQLAKNCHLHRR